MARVVFTEPAEYDLLDIEYYIFVDLCNPQAAQRISDGILGAADKLAEYPEGHPLVGEELLGRWVYALHILITTIFFITMICKMM